MRWCEGGLNEAGMACRRQARCDGHRSRNGAAGPGVRRGHRRECGTSGSSSMSIVIDAHQHFWDPARADYPWMQGAEMAALRRAFGPADLAPLLAKNAIDASIVVQCRSSLEETEEFLQIADVTPA